MKKTNVAILSSAAKWLRILPLLLGLALLSSSDLAAQTYKSLEDATTSVKEALEPIQATYPTDAHVQQGQMSTNERQNLVTGQYLGLYLELLSETQDVEEAVDRLDEMAPDSPQSERGEYISEARDYLMDLITE